jgi:ABC-type antimicrobial peptide transport system permease subunit
MLVVRASSDGLSLQRTVQERLELIDPDMEVGRFRTLDERVTSQLANPRFNMVVVGSFSALAALIALVGVYGIVSHSVEQRTREIGLRMALGADRLAVFRLAVLKGLGIGLTGLAVGMAGAAAATRLIESLLIQVEPTDPSTYVGIAVLVLVASLLASAFPARRATRVDPMAALRHE